MNTDKLIVKRIINAGIDSVFEAFSKPEIMRMWFYPDEDMSAEVSNTFRVGGGYVIKMHTKTGDTYTHTGEYLEIVSPEKIVFTWNSDFVNDTVVTVTLSEAEDGTEVVLSHDFLPEGELTHKHRSGWGGCLDRLDAYFK